MIVVPARMGRLNRRALVNRLQRLGRASRADLAKSLGLSQPTAGKIVDELMGAGIIEEVAEGALDTNGGAAAARLGRPARRLRLAQSQPRFVVVQLGVTRTRVALAPVGAEAEDRWAEEFITPSTAGAWGRALDTAARRLPRGDFWGVLVSVPGIVDEAGAKVVFSPNLHWTAEADLVALVRRGWDRPVILVQEERALALGQQMFDPKGEDFLLVDFGDGVGGAMIVGGQLYVHPLPLSGELGHTPVLGNRRRCGCGATGCVETLVSPRGLLESFETARRRRGAEWPQLVAAVRERGIAPWLAVALDAAAGAVAGALNVLGLRRVILTGALNELGEPVFRHLADAIVRGAMWARFGTVDCEAVPRRRVAGLVAAGLDRLVLPVNTARGDGERPRPIMRIRADNR